MTPVPALQEALAAIPDPRAAQGRRHPLPALLALAATATLCGARSYSAIADWGRNYDQELVRALGFTHTPTPCAATFCLAFRRLDLDQVEAVLAAWAERVVAALPRTATPDALPVEAVALDGKTLRGSRKQGAPGVQLLSALSQRLGLTLGQGGVDDKTNEIGAVTALLRGLVLEGRVFTMDALLTQRALAHTLVDADAHDVMIAKGNQPRLEADIAAEFRTPPPAAIRPGPRRRRRTTATAATSSAC
ncbi:MAG: ISAs1 family transposase [Dehalococcoidia bacterium]